MQIKILSDMNNKTQDLVSAIITSSLVLTSVNFAPPAIAQILASTGSKKNLTNYQIDRTKNTTNTINSNISNIANSSCESVPNAIDEYRALNDFWGTNIPICRIYNVNNAYADHARGVVFADQDWLDLMASRYGSYAATGILAHEWGHMVQGNLSGTAAELQADCLAGVFMKGFGLPWQTVEQFARANWNSADSHWSVDGHGTKTQRVTAARRGYYGYRGQRGSRLVALCPLSAF